MRPAPWAVGLAVLALGACGGGGGEQPQKGQGAETSAAPRRTPQITVRPKAGEPQEAGSIRSWSAAVNRGTYRVAAAFFAPDAIIEQGRVFRLPGRSAAIAFNKGLPCRADVRARRTGRTCAAKSGRSGPVSSRRCASRSVAGEATCTNRAGERRGGKE